MAIDASRLRKRLPEPPPPDEGATGIEQAPAVASESRPQTPAPVTATFPAAPRRLDGRSLRATGRTVQLNVKITEATKETVLQLAQERGLLVSEVIEQAVALLERSE
jgi:hypothetical protein